MKLKILVNGKIKEIDLGEDLELLNYYKIDAITGLHIFPEKDYIYWKHFVEVEKNCNSIMTLIQNDITTGTLAVDQNFNYLLDDFFEQNMIGEPDERTLEFYKNYFPKYYKKVIQN